MATFYVRNTNDSGRGSLRDAIERAGDGDVIRFAPRLKNATIELDSNIEIDKDITIESRSWFGFNIETTISLSPDADVPDGTNGGIFAIKNGADVTLDDLTLTGGRAVNGGAIHVEAGASLTGDELVITNSSADRFGGGIRVEGEVALTDSLVSNNTAKLGGGGINVNGRDGDLHLVNSLITGNSAVNPEVEPGKGGAGDGGGLQVLRGGDAVIEGSTITGNHAVFRYGGLDVRDEGGTNVQVFDSIVAENSQSNSRQPFEVDTVNYLGEASLSVANSSLGLTGRGLTLFDGVAEFSSVEAGEARGQGFDRDQSTGSRFVSVKDRDNTFNLNPLKAELISLESDWGNATLVGFDPNLDILDFQGMAGNVALSETVDGLLIDLLDEDTHSYLLEGVFAEDLTAVSITDWGDIDALNQPGGVYEQLADLGYIM